jgi:hypothetical protein
MRRLVPACVALLVAACAGPAEPVRDPIGSADAGSDSVARDAAAVRSRSQPPAPRLPDEDFGPGILVPRSPSDDGVVAVVGDHEIRKSHVYDRMLESDRRGAGVWVDVLVMDCVVAEQARQFGITVEPSVIDVQAREEEAALEAQVAAEWGDRQPFERYLERQFGLTVAEYREFLRLDLARMRYRSYVIRYLALREDQVEVRFIVHRDPAVLADVREKVIAGADFATLARRWSEDDTRRDGGLLAPFGRAFRHPIAQTAFQLEPGQISEVVPIGGADGERHAIVYCLRRMPARTEPFEAVRAELAAELERRPVTSFEQSAFMMQYCRATAPLDGAQAEPR